MDFFSLSKILWGILAPSHLLVWTSIAAAVLLISGRRRAGLWLALTSTGLLIVMGVLPTYIWLNRPLEYGYFRPFRMPGHVDGILTLGGVKEKNRLVTTYLLSRTFPQARIVYSGGSGLLIGNQPGHDAQVAKRYLGRLGMDLGRLTSEDQSRNTWENILFTQRIVKPKPTETWLLAISAFQIPRTLEIACRLHWKLVAWPTDYLSKPRGISGYFDIPENLKAFDRGVHEWIGVYAYRFDGKSVPLSRCP